MLLLPLSSCRKFLKDFSSEYLKVGFKGYCYIQRGAQRRFVRGLHGGAVTLDS